MTIQHTINEEIETKMVLDTQKQCTKVVCLSIEQVQLYCQGKTISYTSKDSNADISFGCHIRNIHPIIKVRLSKKELLGI